VRVALRLKGLNADMIALDLLKGEQSDPAYRALNPEMVVPTLLDGDGPPLVQSLAILEYLDEKFPDPPLLPSELRARAHVRALAQTVAMDAHPFIVPRVRAYLESRLRVDEVVRTEWIAHWLDEGSKAVEAVLARDARTGKFCCGDSVTIADICLAAHAASVALFGASGLNDYPTMNRIVGNCMHVDAFAREHPLRQPDAPRSA
jgi:maleylacetoacetate isomerase